MSIHYADDWYAQGYRIMSARDIYPGDSYLISYVERVIIETCSTRSELSGGYINIDGNHFLLNQPFWILKH